MNENAEDMLEYLKECIENIEENPEVIVIPTTGDPTLEQHVVSFMVFEKQKDSRIPVFKVTVEKWS